MPIEDMVQVDVNLGKVTILTRSNSKIVIDDPNKLLVVQDINGNRIEMGPEGIKIISPKDIVFEAGGNISLQATGNITTTAKADISQTALNITQSANLAFTAKGAATAELSASGQTTVKGALVLIN